MARKYNESDFERMLDAIPRESARKKVKMLKASQIQKKELLEYNDYLAAQGRSIKRRYEMASFMKNWIIKDMGNKNFEDITKEDIQNYLKKLNADKTKKERGKFMYRQHLKNFFQFYYKYKNKDIEKMENLIGWFKVTQKTQDKKNREQQKDIEYISLEDIRKLLPHCSIKNNARDRALIISLWESGFRSEEILSLNIEDVYKNDQEYIFNHPDLRESMNLEHSRPFLEIWLSIHPRRDNPKAPLWITDYGRMTYDGLNYLLKMIARNTKNEKYKGLRAHLFRDGFATYWSLKVKPDILAKMMGHTNINTVYRYYNKNKMNDIRKEIAKSNGKAIDDNAKLDNVLQPRICMACTHSNAPEALFCNICGNSLTGEAKKAQDIDGMAQRLERLEKMLLARHKDLPENTDLHYSDRGLEYSIKDKKLEY